MKYEYYVVYYFDFRLGAEVVQTVEKFNTAESVEHMVNRLKNENEATDLIILNWKLLRKIEVFV